MPASVSAQASLMLVLITFIVSPPPTLLLRVSRSIAWSTAGMSFKLEYNVAEAATKLIRSDRCQSLAGGDTRLGKQEEAAHVRHRLVPCSANVLFSTKRLLLAPTKSKTPLHQRPLASRPSVRLTCLSYTNNSTPCSGLLCYSVRVHTDRGLHHMYRALSICRRRSWPVACYACALVSLSASRCGGTNRRAARGLNRSN